MKDIWQDLDGRGNMGGLCYTTKIFFTSSFTFILHSKSYGYKKNNLFTKTHVSLVTMLTMH